MSSDTSSRNPMLTVRIPPELDEKIDEIWAERGYASRSEFVRDALRTAIYPPPTLSEEVKAAIREGERERAAGRYKTLDEL